MTVDIHHQPATTILARPSGFIRAFDYTLNPYGGCAFACQYCYAAFFAPTPQQQANWGRWVRVKDNALALLQKKRRRPLIDRSIYMSSVTDPYQPIERRLTLTRSLLIELADHHAVRLVVQTRSPLVVRDLDVLRRLPYARLNMTVTTDDEEVRRAFEPLCPSNEQRLEALAQTAAAGIETCITLTPLLPVRDPEAFARRLLATGARRFVVQDFHSTRSRFVAGTGAEARRLLHERGWTAADYARVRAALMDALPGVQEGQDGFLPG